jgi:hypothetical protein
LRGIVDATIVVIRLAVGEMVVRRAARVCGRHSALPNSRGGSKDRRLLKRTKLSVHQSCFLGKMASNSPFGTTPYRSRHQYAALVVLPGDRASCQCARTLIEKQELIGYAVNLRNDRSVSKVQVILPTVR